MLGILVIAAVILSLLATAQIAAGIALAGEDRRVPPPLVASVAMTGIAYSAVVLTMLARLAITAARHIGG